MNNEEMTSYIDNILIEIWDNLMELYTINDILKENSGKSEGKKENS